MMMEETKTIWRGCWLSPSPMTCGDESQPIKHWWRRRKNKNGRGVGCDQAFCKLYGMSMASTPHEPPSRGACQLE
eukprot:2619548-Pleurochrysis_carterae.AAC.1